MLSVEAQDCLYDSALSCSKLKARVQTRSSLHRPEIPSL